MKQEVAAIFGLSGEAFRNAVLGNAWALSEEVKTLSEDERQRLMEVVENAWPQKGVRANTQHSGHEIHFSDLGAFAWVTLAPALNITPTAEQWSGVATSGVNATSTLDWLRRHYSEEAALLAARSCDAPEARPWSQLIGAIPDNVRVPEEVVEALVSQLTEPTEIELWAIGDRFAREGREEALQALSGKSGELERSLRPWRARAGETEAARLLLEELTSALESGERERDEAEWLESVQDPTLLPDLFAALAASLRVGDASPFGVSTAIGRAIHRIGGEEAVRMYDELVESSEQSQFKFLRLPRDEIVQGELRAAGQASAGEVAERLKLPVLEVVTPTFGSGEQSSA